MQQLKINELKEHPRNTEFFDDMSGDKWEEFLESVRTSGIIEPVIITPDKTIVSGHQRVRACRELGIDTVWCEMRDYENEDTVLKELLETNIRQRGDVGGSAKKVGKRIKELERLYGVSHGNNQYIRTTNNSESTKSQEQLAKDLGISVDTLQNYKLLADMMPELEDLLDTGIVTKTTALAIINQLSQQEQADFISSLEATKKITQKQMLEFIKEYKANNNSDQEIAVYKQKANEYKKQADGYRQDYERVRREIQDKKAENRDLHKQIENMKANESSAKYEKKLQDSAVLFCSRVSTFIEQVGGYIWLTDKLNEIPEFERQAYVSAIGAVKAWADQMDYNINNKLKELR